MWNECHKWYYIPYTRVCTHRYSYIYNNLHLLYIEKLVPVPVPGVVGSVFSLKFLFPHPLLTTPKSGV